MRNFLTLLICLLSLPAPLYAGDAQDSLQITTQIAKTGAKQLALARIQFEQPAVKDRARWFELEKLHMTLLADLDRHRALLKRVEMLPPDTPQSVQRLAYGLAANAALQLHQAEKSRGYLLHQLWDAELPEMDVKRARYQLIETCLEDKPAAAYQAMLRYQQDYSAPDQHQLQRLLRVLLLNGMEKEAATWLPQLAENDPLKLGIRLKTGAVSPEAAMAAARLAVHNGGGQDSWLVIMQAATLINNAGARIEAQEQLLNARTLSAGELQKINPANLWQDYMAYAQTLGNSNHLLSGDDASWTAQATQWATTAPLNARVFWAYLSEHAVEPSLREKALAELYLSLLDARMGVTMMRLVKSQAHNQDEEKQKLAYLQALASDTQQQVLLLAQSQSAEAQGNYAVAADLSMQGVVLRESEQLDPITLQLYASAVDNLNRAGLAEDAKAIQDRLVRLKLMRNIPAQPAANLPN